MTSTPSPRASRGTLLGLTAVLLAQLMLLVDATIVNVALPDIQRSLQFSDSGLSWVVTAYALGFAGLMLVTGTIGARWGAKRTLILGTVIFVVASALGGLAPTAETLVAARALQGLGAAFAAPSTLVLLVAATPVGPRRDHAMALFVLAGGAGGAIGLILGGVLTTAFGWEWVLLVNLPIGALIIVLASAFLRETERLPARVDVAGAALCVIAMVALVYAFTEAAALGWESPVVIRALVVAALALVALLPVERRHPAPVVPLGLLGRRGTAIPLATTLLMSSGMFAFFYVFALFTQEGLGFDALGTGLGLLPMVVVMSILAQVSGRILLPRFGERLIGSIGLALDVVGLLWLASLAPGDTYASGVLGPLIVLGVGGGLALAPLTGLVMAHARPEHATAASSVLQTAQQLGGSIGVAVLSTVFASAGQGLAGVAPALIGGSLFVGGGLVLFSLRARSAPGRTRGDASVGGSEQNPALAPE